MEQRNIPNFVLYLFRRVANGVYSVEDIKAIVNGIHGDGASNVSNILKAISNEWTKPRRSVEVIAFLKSHPTILQPIVVLHSSCRKLLGGEAFWSTITRYREKRGVPVSEPEYLDDKVKHVLEQYTKFKDRSLEKNAKKETELKANNSNRDKAQRDPAAKGMFAAIKRCFKCFGNVIGRKHAKITERPSTEDSFSRAHDFGEEGKSQRSDSNKSVAWGEAAKGKHGTTDSTQDFVEYVKHIDMDNTSEAHHASHRHSSGKENKNKQPGNLRVDASSSKSDKVNCHSPHAISPSQKQDPSKKEQHLSSKQSNRSSPLHKVS
jgi:hypothetical protein